MHMAFECFSSTFQGKFNFEGLLKTVLYIQVLFKPVQTLNKHSSFVIGFHNFLENYLKCHCH